MENDVVSENAITLTFCLKIRDYDDGAFLRIEVYAKRRYYTESKICECR